MCLETCGMDTCADSSREGNSGLAWVLRIDICDDVGPVVPDGRKSRFELARGVLKGPKEAVGLMAFGVNPHEADESVVPTFLGGPPIPLAIASSLGRIGGKLAVGPITRDHVPDPRNRVICIPRGQHDHVFDYLAVPAG